MEHYLDCLRKKPHLYAWEKDYRLRGSLWRGSTELDLRTYVKKGSKVLEVGCGNGKTAKALSSQGFDVTGIDISPTAVTLAKKECPSGKFEVGDVTKLKFNASSFDAVVLWHVLDHLLLAERKKAIKQAKRVLKPGGLVAFEGFAVGDMRFGKGKEVEHNTFRRGNNIYYHYFTKDEANRLFKGFKIIELLELVQEKKFRKGQKRASIRVIGVKT